MLLDKKVVTRVTVGYEPDYTQFERGQNFVEIRVGTHGEHLAYLADTDFVRAVVALGLAAQVRETDRDSRATDAWLQRVKSGLQTDTSDGARKYFVRVWEADHPE